MNATLKRINHYLKVILCLCLMMQVQIFSSGCGLPALQLGAPGGWLSISLTQDHPLSEVLLGTHFEGAVAFEVNPASQAFRLVYPDDARVVSGQYEFSGGEFTIRQFHVETAGADATLQLDSDKRIVSITTSEGISWQRPDASVDDPGSAVNTVATDYPGANEDLLDVVGQIDPDSAGSQNNTSEPGSAANTGATDYASANADLLGIVALIDADSGSAGSQNNPSELGFGETKASLDGSSGPFSALKPAAARSGGLEAVLVLLATLWAPLAMLMNSLLGFFIFGAMVDALLSTRLDGQWSATNADSNLNVTVSAGRIVQIVEAAGNQEFELVNSELQSSTNNHVVWRVLAKVPGQALDVEFTFDMQEVDRNTLEGTLSALGDTVARVAVTMTRM